MNQPKPLTAQLEREFAKLNAARKPVTYTRECWCPGLECRWRDPEATCPNRTDLYDGVQLYTT